MKLEEAKRKIKEIYELTKPFNGVVFLPRQGAVKVDWGVEDPREFIRHVFAEGGFRKNLELKGKLKASEILNYIYDMAKLQSKQLIDAYYMNKYYEYIKEKDSNILKGLGYVAQYTLFETIPKALAERTLGFSELITYGLKKIGVDEFSDVYNYAMARKAELKLYNNAAEKFMADYITNKGFGGAVSGIMHLASFMYGFGTIASGVRKLGMVWASAYPEKFLGKVGRFLIAPEIEGVPLIKKAISEALTFTAFDQIASFVSPYRYSIAELFKDAIWGKKPTGEQVFEGVAGFFTGLLWGAVPTISKAIDVGIRGIATKYPRSYIVGLGARILNNPVSGAVLNELKNTPAFLIAEIGSQGISQATAEILKTLGYSIGPINVNLWEGIYGVGLMQLFNMGIAGALGVRYKRFRNQLLNELERAFSDIEGQMRRKEQILQTETPSGIEGTKIGDEIQPHFDEFRKAVDNLQMARDVVFARTLKTNALLEIAQNYGLLDRVGVEPSKLDMPTALYIAHKELMKSFASIYQTLGYIYQRKPELLKDKNLGLPVIEALRKGLEHIADDIERATGGRYRVIVQFDKQMNNGFIPIKNILVAQYDQGKLKMTEILNFGGFKGKIVEVDNNSEAILTDIKKFANDFLKNYTIDGKKTILDLYYENTVSQLYKDLVEVFFNPFKVFFGNRHITAYKNQQNFLKLFEKFRGLIKPEDLVIKFNNLASKYNLPLIYSELVGDLGTYWEVRPVYAVFNLGGEPVAIPFVVLAGPDGKIFAQEGLRMLEKTGYVRFVDSGGFNPQLLIEGNLWGRELKREDVKNMQEMVRKMIKLPNDLNNLLGETSLAIFFNEFIKEKLGVPGFDIREIMKKDVGSGEIKKLQSALETGEVDRVIEVLKEVAEAAIYDQVKDDPEKQKELASVIVANAQTQIPSPPPEVVKKEIELPRVEAEPVKPEVILNLQARYELMKQRHINLRLSPAEVISDYQNLLYDIASWGQRPELNDLISSIIRDLQDLKSKIQKGQVPNTKLSDPENPIEIYMIDDLIENFNRQLKAIGELDLKQKQIELIEKVKQEEAARQTQAIIKYINDEFTFKSELPKLLREYMALGYLIENPDANAKEIAKLFNLDEKRADELIKGKRGKKSVDTIYVIRSNLKSQIMELRDKFVEAFAKLYPHLDEAERGVKMLEVIRSWGLNQGEIDELFRLFTDEKLNVKLEPDHDFVKFLNTSIKGTEFGSVDFGTVLSPTGQILYRREGVPAVLEAFPGEKTYQEISEHFKPREIKTVKDWIISSVWSAAEGLLQKVSAPPEVKKEVYETLARIIDNLDTRGGYEDLLNYLNEVVKIRVRIGEIKKLIEPMEKISDEEFKKLKKEGKVPKNWSKEKWVMEKAKELEAIQPEDVMIYHITPLTRKKLSHLLADADHTKNEARKRVKYENIISKGIFFRDIYEKTAVSGQAGPASILHKHTATIEDVISAILLKLWRNVDWTGAKSELGAEGLIVRTEEGEELSVLENLPAGPEAIPSFVFENAVNHKGLANMIDKIYKNYKELNLGVFLGSFGRGVKEHLGMWGKSAEDIKMLGINLKNLNLEKITEENREMYEQLIDLFSGFVLAFPEPKGNMEKAFNMLSEALKGVVLDAQTSPGNFEAKAMLSMIDRFKNKFADFLVKNSDYIESVFKSNRQDRYIILGRKLLEALDIKDYARSMRVVSDVLGILKTYIGSYSPTLVFFLVPELWLLLKEIWDWEVENASRG